MSVVEKALRKAREAKQGGAEPVAGEAAAQADANSRPSAPHAFAGAQSPPIVLDRAALRAAGLLPPVAEERRLSSQYRKIKRPLIANAIGRGADRLPNGYLIMLASAMPGEGKTFTALNLALSIATEKDFSVLLVDADVAKPQLSRIFGLEGEQGLLDVLRDPQLDVDSAIRPTDIPTLSFLPAGKSSADATELLASKRMEELAQRLGERDSHRIVLFDTPPLIQTTESPALMHVAGQVLVVVRAESTPQPVLLDALETLQEHPAVSLVLNQSMRSDTAAYYYYGYGEERSDRSTAPPSE
ncbi:MAG: AAA family ATPase [Proteobacteria bacterium]|nr:AAA family ATPase [Pseudomonadota bacterium]